jgi:hypothetical protein
MHELHLRYLDARLAGEAAPPGAAEVRLRARAHGRLLARDRVAPGSERRAPARLAAVREQRAPARTARV